MYSGTCKWIAHRRISWLLQRLVMRFSNKTDMVSSAIWWWKRFGRLVSSWLSSTFKSHKEVICLLAYIMGLFKIPFIELALSLCIDYLGHCTDPSLPIPSFLTDHGGRWLSFIHHLTPLQTGKHSPTQLAVHRKNLVSPERECFKYSVTD